MTSLGGVGLICALVGTVATTVTAAAFVRSSLTEMNVLCKTSLIHTGISEMREKSAPSVKASPIPISARISDRLISYSYSNFGSPASTGVQETEERSALILSPVRDAVYSEKSTSLSSRSATN